MTPIHGYTLYDGDNVIKVNYGQWNFLRSSGKRHKGADASTTGNKSIRRVAPGCIEFAGMIPKGNDATWEWGYHERCYINQTDTVRRVGTIRIVYAHCEAGSLTGKAGQVVQAGTVLGVMGDSGNASLDSQGKHCHVQVDKWNGSAWVNMDPTPYIGGTNKAGGVWYGSTPKYANVPSPVQDFGYGCDISAAQVTFDPKKALANNIKTVMIRATYSDEKDIKLDTFAPAALAAGMNVGFYHFPTWHYAAITPNGDIATARAHMQRQTKAFLAHIAPYTPTSYIALDYEIETHLGHKTNLSIADQTTIINEQLAMYESYGYRCMFYTGLNTGLDLYDIYNPVWIAHYGRNNETGFGNGYFWDNDTPYYKQRMKDNEYHIYMWQFSSVGDGKTLAGTGGTGRMDLNYTYMPMAVMHDLKPAPAPTPEGDDNMPMSTESVKMWIGPMSGGDRNTVIKKLDELAIGYIEADSKIYTSVAVSPGDQTPIMALAVQLVLGYGPACETIIDGVTQEEYDALKARGDKAIDYMAQVQAGAQQAQTGAQQANSAAEMARKTWEG